MLRVMVLESGGDAALAGPGRDASEIIEDLVRRWDRQIRGAAMKYGLMGPDFEEVAQDVRVRLWRAFEGRGKTPAQLTPGYVYRAAMSAAVDIVRRRRREHPPQRVPIDQLGEVAAMAGVEDEERVLAALERALARVPESRRPAVRLHLMGRHLDEIARIMGWTGTRARNQLYRGLDDLREALHRESSAE